MGNADLSEKGGTLIKHKILLSHVKMYHEIKTICDYDFEKHKVQRYRSPIFLENIGTDNILVTNKNSSG